MLIFFVFCIYMIIKTTKWSNPQIIKKSDKINLAAKQQQYSASVGVCLMHTGGLRISNTVSQLFLTPSHLIIDTEYQTFHLPLEQINKAKTETLIDSKYTTVKNPVKTVSRPSLMSSRIRVGRVYGGGTKKVLASRKRIHKLSISYSDKTGIANTIWFSGNTPKDCKKISVPLNKIIKDRGYNQIVNIPKEIKKTNVDL